MANVVATLKPREFGRDVTNATNSNQAQLHGGKNSLTTNTNHSVIIEPSATSTQRIVPSDSGLSMGTGPSTTAYGVAKKHDVNNKVKL